MNTIDHKKLTEKLRYDPEAGLFFWRSGNRRGTNAGDVAGWNNGKMAWRINIGGKYFLAHRLAWFYVHRTWPEQIDHINGNRMDNRLCNLRPATNSQNQANTSAKKNNKLGIRGISFQRNRYLVQLRRGKNKIIRYFGKLDEAKEFAVAASKELHGEFSVHNRNAQ